MLVQLLPPANENRIPLRLPESPREVTGSGNDRAEQRSAGSPWLAARLFGVLLAVSALLFPLLDPLPFGRAGENVPGLTFAQIDETLPPPKPQAADIPQNGGVQLPPWTNGCWPITFAAALRLAQTSNLDISRAAETLSRTRAEQLQAQVLVLPNVGVGSTYARHEGTIAKTEGNIIYANKDALFAGEYGTASFSFSDAIFAPLAARQIVTAAGAGLDRVKNDTLMRVADAYLNMLRARRRLAAAQETLEYLTAQQSSPTRAGSKGLLPLVQDVVAAGAKEAFPADVERVRVEIFRRQEELIGALQDYRVASAELARLIRLDPEIPLCPMEDFRVPMPLPGEDLVHKPTHELVTLALVGRPELAENRALVQAAIDRVSQAKVRPLLPQATLNYNWGGFGGGPDPNPPLISPATTPGGTPTVRTVTGFGPSGRILHFDTRMDFDATLVWRLNNFGFGNLAEVRAQQARYRQAMADQLSSQDLVVAQVVQAQEMVEGWRGRMDVTRLALFGKDDQGEGPVFRAMRLDFLRIRNREGRPLEALDSIRRLSDLLTAYGQATTDYERSRFRLLYAVGIPAEALADPAKMPHLPGTVSPDGIPNPAAGGNVDKIPVGVGGGPSINAVSQEKHQRNGVASP